MPFEVRVISNTPLVGESDIREAVKIFMTQIGYISHGSENNTALALFLDCFLLHPDRAWTAEELMSEINTSRPTLYRHLNRLKSLDILEETSLPNPKEPSSKPKKGYALKYGNFKKAWTFTDAHIMVALENYNSSVNHIQKLLEEHKKR
jgi:predicted transcriptional regulator